jgi:hypothetical protein
MNCNKYIKMFIFLFAVTIGTAVIGCASKPAADKTTSSLTNTPATSTSPADSTSTAPPSTAVTDVAARNAALLAEAQAAHDAAIAANAEQSCPDQLAALDALFDTVKKDAAANPASPDVSAKLLDIAQRYKALEKTAQALYLKERVDGLEFAPYDSASYAKGEAALALLTAADVQSAPAQTLLDNATVAFDSYSAVLFAGFSAEADKAKQAADASKAKADSVKASVAAREAYAGASNYYREGQANIADRLPEAAVADFQAAQIAFEEVYEDVLARREAALAAIRKAEQAAQDVEDFAREADEIAPLEEEGGVQ